MPYSSYLLLLLFLFPSWTIAAPSYVQWLERFGHDDYTYPDFILEAMNNCDCAIVEGSEVPVCRRFPINVVVSWRAAVASARAHDGSDDLDFCTAKAWLLEHMPSFDLDYLPPSISVNVTSMLDDVAAFAVMADKVMSSFQVPLVQKLRYVLPYASYHEARTNWRPLLFAKHVSFVNGATSTEDAMARLVAPNVFLSWGTNSWEGAPNAESANSSTYEIEWDSSTAPPVVSPFEFATYGYASCSGWSSMVTYIARSVGIPARQVGTPCWDGGDFRGPAISNANVTRCWKGGDGQTQGGSWLYNHNWVEYWHDIRQEWVFLNVPPSTSIPNDGLSGCDAATFDDHGCGWNATGMPGKECEAAFQKGAAPATASQDHEIFAATWSFVEDDPETDDDASSLEGGAVVDAGTMTLTDGTAVSPLVWAPKLQSPLGTPLKNIGLRFVNRTLAYRCHK